jgi:hypothetical protein
MGIKVLRFRSLVACCGRGGREANTHFLQFHWGLRQTPRRAGGRSIPPLRPAYNLKPVWRRIVVLLAGLRQFLFAVVAYWICWWSVPGLKPVIGDVTADSLLPGPGCSRAMRSSAWPAGHHTRGAVLRVLDRLMDGTPIELECGQGRATPQAHS